MQFSIDRGRPRILSAIQVKVRIQHLSPMSCFKDSSGSGPETARFRIFRHSRASLGLPAISGPGSHGVAPTSHTINSIASSSTHTHSLSLSLSYTLSIRSLFPSLVALHHPWTATACISLANGSWILVDPPRVPAPCAVFVSMRRYSSSTHSTPISPLSFEAVKPLRRRLSLGHVAPLSLRAPSVAISASVLLLSYLRIPRHSSRHLVPYGLGSLS